MTKYRAFLLGDTGSAFLGTGYGAEEGWETAAHLAGQPDYEGAKQHALDRLRSELAPELTYHSFSHTNDDVLPAALRLASACGMGEAETRLIEISAAYHDTGFLVQHNDHERAGVNLVARVLPGFGFSLGQVSAVQGMILATRLPQRPQTLLVTPSCIS